MTPVVFLNLLLEALLFVGALFCTLFIPGFAVSLKIPRLTLLERLVVSFTVGIALFGVETYITGYLGLRNFNVLYVISAAVLGIFLQKKVRSFFSEIRGQLAQVDLTAVFLVGIGTTVQILQMIGTGLVQTDGMRFFRVHAQDGIFHLSLIASMMRKFPPIEPGAAGLAVVNYHYWSDMVLAEFSRLFQIPVHTLFFQLTPFFVSILTALSLIALVRYLSKSEEVSLSRNWQRFALFFLYFGSDIAYLFMLKLHGIWGFYTSGIDNGATQFLNMPHVFAKWIFLVAVLLLLKWRDEKKLSLGLVCGLLAGVLFGMKIYFALLFVVIYALFGLWELIRIVRSRKISEFFSQYLIVSFFTSLLGLAIYLPPNQGSGGLGWYPLEWVKLMLSRENLDWTDLSIRRALAQYYQNQTKIILFDIVAITATLLSIHGTRLLGFLFVPRNGGRTHKLFWFSSLIASVLFTFLGLYTLQKSGAFNVFNFFASSMTLLAIFSARVLAEFWESKKIFLRLAVLAVCILTIPRIVFETGKILDSYAKNTDVTLITKDEIDALSYVASNSGPDAVIQSHPDNALDAHTPYVSYFANRESYIAGANVLETHNQPTKDRLTELRSIFTQSDPQAFHDALARQKIQFLYILKGEKLPVEPAQAGIRVVYANKSATVYFIE